MRLLSDFKLLTNRSRGWQGMKWNLAGGRRGPSLQGMVNAGKYQPTTLLGKAKLSFTWECKWKPAGALRGTKAEADQGSMAMGLRGTRKKMMASKPGAHVREPIHAGGRERTTNAVVWGRCRASKAREQQATRAGGKRAGQARPRGPHAGQSEEREKGQQAWACSAPGSWLTAAGPAAWATILGLNLF